MTGPTRQLIGGLIVLAALAVVIVGFAETTFLQPAESDTPAE